MRRCNRPCLWSVLGLIETVESASDQRTEAKRTTGTSVGRGEREVKNKTIDEYEFLFQGNFAL